MLTEKQILLAKSTRLSTNFTLWELIRSKHTDLIEWPSTDVIRELRKLAQNILQPIRDKWGRIKINSGYRNPTLNKKVGGVRNSIHQVVYNNEIIGAASDIVPLDAELEEVFEWAYDNIDDLKTIIIYRKPEVIKNPFIHMDNRYNRERVGKMEKFGPGDYKYI